MSGRHIGRRAAVVSWLVAMCCLGAASCRNSPASETPAAGAAAVSPQPTAILSPGDPAPDFVLPGSDGQTHSLATYKGKQAVVLAWFAKAFTDG